jgi:hypothetical protein
MSLITNKFEKNYSDQYDLDSDQDDLDLDQDDLDQDQILEEQVIEDKVFKSYSQESENVHPDTWFPDHRNCTSCNGYINTCKISHRIQSESKMISTYNVVNTNKDVQNVSKCKNGDSCKFRKYGKCKFGH